MSAEVFLLSPVPERHDAIRTWDAFAGQWNIVEMDGDDVEDPVSSVVLERWAKRDWRQWFTRARRWWRWVRRATRERFRRQWRDPEEAEAAIDSWASDK